MSTGSGRLVTIRAVGEEKAQVSPGFVLQNNRVARQYGSSKFIRALGLEQVDCQLAGQEEGFQERDVWCLVGNCIREMQGIVQDVLSWHFGVTFFIDS